MIKNVVFDIGNVLVSFGWVEYFKSFGLTDEEFERIANATVKDPIWNEIDRGVMSEDEILEAFIKNAPEMEEKIRAMYENFGGLLTMFEYTKGWILDLQKRGYKVYCLSNMSYKAVRECWDALCFLDMTDGYVLSCDVKLTKPEPEIYQTLFDKYKLVPSECVFFDDLPANIEAANKQGMHGVVFENLKQAEEELSKITLENGKPDSAGTSRYSRKQRIGAIACLSIIALMYLVTLVCTFLKSDTARTLLRISLGCTLVLPILTWVYIWIIGKLTRKDTIADFHFFEKLK